jgi:hypothetical protein
MATVTLSRGTTLPDSSSKTDFHNLVDTATATVSNIVNADIDSAAAIADSKLAQITTAAKVSGAAVTLLTSVPSGAGVLPNINNIGGALEIVFDNAGSAIEAGSHLEVMVPKAITITGAYAFADVSGSIVVDVWKDTIANYPPTDADTITASAPITITTATNSTDTTLTGWTTAVAALSVLKFNVDSCTSITKCTIVLTYNRA